MMFYMLYMSTAVKPMRYDDFSALLQQCRDSNDKHGITGMLLYQNGTFMQMLEGERQVVLDLYDKILKDGRHTGVHTVLTGNIEKRNFEDWSMGFFNMDKAGEFPQYGDYIDQKLALRSFEPGSQDAYEFMMMFNKINQ
jgi:hypothetical protein